jgi:hypothetical protein
MSIFASFRAWSRSPDASAFRPGADQPTSMADNPNKGVAARPVPMSRGRFPITARYGNSGSYRMGAGGPTTQEISRITNHIEKEDGILFPFIQVLISSALDQKVSAKFEKFQLDLSLLDDLRRLEWKYLRKTLQ